MLAQLTDRRVSSQNTATFGDKPRVEKYLPWTKLLTCICECFVNVVVDARVKPNPLHSAEWMQDLLELVISRFDVRAVFHLAEDGGQILSHLMPLLIALLQESKGLLCHCADVFVLAGPHAFFREGLEIFGERDHVGGVRHEYQ
jgi:hypothetical protein